MYATLVSGKRTLPGEKFEQRMLRATTGLNGLGLVQGDVVGILMRNDFPMLEMILGAERAGMVPVPLNWHASVDELAYILRDSQAGLLLGHTDLLKPLAGSVPARCRVLQTPPPPEVCQAYRLPDEACAPLEGTRQYEDWLAASAPSTDAPLPPPFRLLYTSGTSGRPKGVKRARSTAEMAERLALRVRVAHGLEMRPIRAVMPGPLYHSAPNVYALNCMRYAELLVLQPKFDAEALLNLVTRHRLSHMHIVPTMFSRLLDLPRERRDRFDSSTMVAAVHGAAMCPREIKQAMIDWWGPVLLEYYAATEVGIITASTSQQWLARPGTVGVPPEGVQIRVVDDQGQPVPTGEKGEIFIHSDMAGLVSYHNRPEAMEELCRGEWVTLGDIGYVDSDGFLWICDRKKDMVISGGVNIFPAEVEHVALQLADVRDCVVFGIPDRDLGEALALVVEPQPGCQLDLEGVRESIRVRLGRMRAPKVVVSMAELPREDTGKIARRKLKQQYLENLAQAA